MAYFPRFVGVLGLSGAWVRTEPANFRAACVELFCCNTFPASDDRSLDDFSFFAIVTPCGKWREYPIPRLIRDDPLRRVRQRSNMLQCNKHVVGPAGGSPHAGRE